MSRANIYVASGKLNPPLLSLCEAGGMWPLRLSLFVGLPLDGVPPEQEFFQGLVEVQHCIGKVAGKVYHSAVFRDRKPEEEMVLRRQQNKCPQADGAAAFVSGCSVLLPVPRNNARSKGLIDAFQRQLPRNTEQFCRTHCPATHPAATTLRILPRS